MKTCSVEGCDKVHRAKGYCKSHYRMMMRGTLDNPRYSVPRTAPGRPVWWPFEFTKIDGDWHRRPTESTGGWELVVWEDKWEQVS